MPIAALHATLGLCTNQPAPLTAAATRCVQHGLSDDVDLMHEVCARLDAARAPSASEAEQLQALARRWKAKKELARRRRHANVMELVDMEAEQEYMWEENVEAAAMRMEWDAACLLQRQILGHKGRMRAYLMKQVRVKEKAFAFKLAQQDARDEAMRREQERERRRDPAERAVLPPLALHVVVVVHDYLLDAPVVRVGGRRLLLVRLGAPVLVELALVVHDEARAHARAPHRAEGGPPLVLLREDERVGPVAHLVRLPKPRRRLEGHDPAAHEVVQGVEGQHQE